MVGHASEPRTTKTRGWQARFGTHKTGPRKPGARHTPSVPAACGAEAGRVWEFQASQCYTVRPCLKKIHKGTQKQKYKAD